MQYCTLYVAWFSLAVALAPLLLLMRALLQSLRSIVDVWSSLNSDYYCSLEVAVYARGELRRLAVQHGLQFYPERVVSIETCKATIKEMSLP